MSSREEQTPILTGWIKIATASLARRSPMLHSKNPTQRDLAHGNFPETYSAASQKFPIPNLCSQSGDTID
jgi:hypothetical protein